jgi:hypothetical protein
MASSCQAYLHFSMNLADLHMFSAIPNIIPGLTLYSESVILSKHGIARYGHMCQHASGLRESAFDRLNDCCRSSLRATFAQWQIA